jgi:uncharacterized membrane protein
MLLWLQTITIALGGLPLFGLARRRLGTDWSALVMVAAYYLLPALESVTLFEFHAVGLAPTLLLAALYFLDRALVTADDPRGLWMGSVADARSRATAGWLSGLFFLLSMGTKEDISLHVFVLGLYLLVLRRRWRPGLVLTTVGLAWFYVAFYVVIPGSRPSGAGSAYTGFFATLGDTPLEIALAPLTAPGKVLALLATPENIRAVKMLTLPLAFTPVAGLPLFLLTLPTLAVTSLSSNPLMHQLETYHYAAPAIPFVMLAAVDGVARLSNLKPQTANIRTGSILSVLLLVTSVAYHYYRGYSPLARSFHLPVVTAHQRLGDKLAASIPALEPVIAQAELVPLVSHRPWIQIWQGPFDERADYFLLDVSHPAFVNRDGAQESLLSDIAQDPTVGLIASQDGYLLLEQGASRRPTTPEFFTFACGNPPDAAISVAATFGQTLRLVAVETRRNYADREAEPLVILYWQVLAPPDEDYFIAIFLLDEAGNPVGVTRYQQPLTVWWPTSRWEPGCTVRLLANTFSWWTGDQSHFGYGVSVVRSRESVSVSAVEPWDVTSRLPVTLDGDSPVLLDGGTLLPLVEFRRVAGIPYQVKMKQGPRMSLRVGDEP